jgi:hypothetical protein
VAVIAQAPAILDLIAVNGDDLTLNITVTDNSVAYSWTGATISTSIVDTSNNVNATNFTATTAVGGLLTLSLSDTNTSTLGAGTWRWQVNVTKATITRTWLAGALTIMDRGWGGSSTSSASASLQSGTLAFAITS